MSSNRTFTVKTVGGAKEELSISADTTFESFCQTIRSTFSFDDDRRLKVICNGTILNDERFSTIPDRSTIICLATRPTTAPAPAPAPQPVEQQQPVQQTATVETTSTTQTDASTGSEPTYSFKQVQAYTIVFLNFISSNPQLRDAFLNNYGLLVTELAKSEQLEEIMKNILSQSGQIMEAMEKGENIKVNINTNDNSMEQIELTPEDHQKIEQLIAMGFNPDQVVVEYLKSGKDIQLTLQALHGGN
jgi:hypothetical protein